MMTRRALGVGVLAAWLAASGAGPAAGQAPPAAGPAAAPSVRLEDLTWTELRALVQAGATTVIVPVGGTEQNGPHMALGKHNARVRALAERIALALGGTLVAPVMAYVPEGALSPPGGHMRYPGTLTVPEDAFRATVESAARSLRLHGFRDVVLLGDHGGTQASLRAVAARLGREWAGTPARIHYVEEYYRASDAGVRALLAAHGFRPEELGTHAGLADTALMLAVDPRLVRQDRLAPGTGLRGGDGVDGDPRRATAELGRPGADAVVSATVEAIRRATRPR